MAVIGGIKIKVVGQYDVEDLEFEFQKIQGLNIQPAGVLQQGSYQGNVAGATVELLPIGEEDTGVRVKDDDGNTVFEAIIVLR